MLTERLMTHVALGSILFGILDNIASVLTLELFIEMSLNEGNVEITLIKVKFILIALTY